MVEDSCYIQVQHEKARYFRAKLPKNHIADDTGADFFLPLGWLVENGRDGGYCPTRYVCLLNVSSLPMSVWLLYDYIFEDIDDDRLIELEDTEMVYDYSIDERATGVLTVARDLFQGQDIVLLYRDIADWDPKGGSCEFADLLGSSTRAVTCRPPKLLLDNITTASPTF